MFANSPLFSESELSRRLLILQCDSGHLYGDLIACARYRIDDEREKVYRLREKSKYQGVTHVLLIVHLPRHTQSRQKKNFSFVGFQGGSWVSAHIDDIHVTSRSGITLNDAMSASISQLFYNMPFEQPQEIDPVYAVETYNKAVETESAREKKLSQEDSTAGSCDSLTDIPRKIDLPLEEKSPICEDKQKEALFARKDIETSKETGIAEEDNQGNEADPEVLPVQDIETDEEESISNKKEVETAFSSDEQEKMYTPPTNYNIDDATSKSARSTEETENDSEGDETSANDDNEAEDETERQVDAVSHSTHSSDDNKQEEIFQEEDPLFRVILRPNEDEVKDDDGGNADGERFDMELEDIEDNNCEDMEEVNQPVVSKDEEFKEKDAKESAADTKIQQVWVLYCYSWLSVVLNYNIYCLHSFLTFIPILSLERGTLNVEDFISVFSQPLP